LTIVVIDRACEQAALRHQAQLTKPAGALGRLEEVAVWFAARQGKVNPERLRPHIAVFAGDHGVCAEGVSAFPSVVTGEMVKNFSRGGAAINVLARQCGASLSVIDVGVASELPALHGVVAAKVAAGTNNLLTGPAMTVEQCAAAIEVGRRAAAAAIADGANLLIAGDMGIGNTTASACLICRFTEAAPRNVVGRGTGIDDAAHRRKVAVVAQALARIEGCPDGEVLAEVGGLEIAAMAGFYLEAAGQGVPAVVDGFIAAAAALAAKQIEPAVADWLLASHVSQENGHAIALASLGLSPMIDLCMRLGEGSGAALIVPLLNSAIALHNEMATFASAGVSEKG